jgi:hypothetical protein
MGQATYYLKARFHSAEDAEAARLRLVELLAEGEKAYRYWRSVLAPYGEDPKWRPISAERFWNTFRANYPLACRYLRHLAGRPDWQSELEYWMDCLHDPRTGRIASLSRVADTLFLRLNDIWHCTQLDLLERYCREDLGAIGVGWRSDGDFDPDEREDGNFDPFLAINA